jgi:hypothetical protein
MLVAQQAFMSTCRALYQERIDQEHGDVDQPMSHAHPQ